MSDKTRPSAARRGDPLSRLPRLSLAGSVYLFVFGTALAVIVGVSFFFFSRSDRFLDTALDSAVRLRSEAAAETFTRTLYGVWRDLEALAEDLPAASRDVAQGRIEGLAGPGRGIVWVGIAGTDGTVRQATGDMLVGADVSGRDWFRAGLRGPIARDVHEALLLARAMENASPAEEPLRLLDMAYPLRGPGGEVEGVVGMHLDFGWAQRALTESARTLGIDVYLIDASGRVIVASSGERLNQAELDILRAARAGGPTAGREVWPDGKAYFSSLVPAVGYGDLPSFGWRLVGRLPADAFRSGLADLRVSALWSLAGLAAILAVSTATFVLLIVRQIDALGRSAVRIARGALVYPPEANRTREAAQLSAALTLVQERELSARGTAPPDAGPDRR